MRKKHIKGVTLVEIAIVLVIIGLLLGGVLKGQELINNAKVRAIADRQNSLKVAWFAFIDRFQALPGDYVSAQQYIPGAANGDGDGYIEEMESTIVMQHLAGAGYIRCPQCNADVAEAPSAMNSLQNNYGGTMSIWADGVNYASVGGPNNSLRLMIHTGPRIPSNIISEVDRKLDDGGANTGDVVFNQYDPGVLPPDVGLCTSSAADTQTGGTLADVEANFYRHATATPPVEQNCGASVNI